MLQYILNDQLINQDDAFVHVSDLALLRGYGVFDFFRLEDRVPLFIDDHIDRFFNSAKKLRLASPLTKEELKEKILSMLSVNKMANSGVRMVLTGGESPNGYAIGDPTLFVINEPINPLPPSQLKDGIKLISWEYKRELPEVKSINYLMAVFLQPELIRAGATDILYYFNGKISELTRSNFYIVDKDNNIVTPDMGILRGITRKKILDIARDYKNIEERALYLDELKTAREAFITGTTKKVMPVVQIDNQIIGDGIPGSVTKQLQRLFEKHVMQYCKEHERIAVKSAK